MKYILSIILAITLCMPISAVEPGEVLDDPLLETRARAISQGLRCLQCRNESIDESNADIARDLRVLVRDRLVAGDSDSEVLDHITARYGEFVLLHPNGLGANLILWLSGPALLLLTLAGLFVARRVRPKHPDDPLSDDEEREIDQLLSK